MSEAVPLSIAKSGFNALKKGIPKIPESAGADDIFSSPELLVCCWVFPSPTLILTLLLSFLDLGFNILPKRFLNSSMLFNFEEFDTSCFNGEYVTGGITNNFLKELHYNR